MYFCGFICYFSPFISYFIYLGPISFLFWVWLKVCQSCWSFQRASTWFDWSFVLFFSLYVIYYISVLIFIIFFLLLAMQILFLHKYFTDYSSGLWIFSILNFQHNFFSTCCVTDKGNFWVRMNKWGIILFPVNFGIYLFVVFLSRSFRYKVRFFWFLAESLPVLLWIFLFGMLLLPIDFRLLYSHFNFFQDIF